MRFTWDDYRANGRGEKRASTDRGWVNLRDKMPGVDVTHPVGFYLSYHGTGEPGENGKRVLASAYYRPTDEHGYTRSTVNLGSSWHETVTDARAWIERTVTERLSTEAPSTR